MIFNLLTNPAVLKAYRLASVMVEEFCLGNETQRRTIVW